jgi:hypothetical protein
LVENFLAAYARGDEAAAERVASPLYAAEWARRGLTSAQRAGLAPGSRARDRSGVWAHFTYAGTIAGRAGFAHHLYVAWPANLAIGQRPRPSVWRLDTAPDGRVIWLELVWLCADEGTRLAPVSGAAGPHEAGAPPLPATLTATPASVVLAVRSAGGQEGYYALRLPQDQGDAPGGGSDVRFVGVDVQGVARPGAWTYGQRVTGPSEYGAPPRPFEEALAPEYQALQRAYLGSLAI